MESALLGNKNSFRYPLSIQCDDLTLLGTFLSMFSVESGPFLKIRLDTCVIAAPVGPPNGGRRRHYIVSSILYFSCLSE